MEKVLMISTGGTISMSVDENEGGAVPSVETSQLINMVKEVRSVAEVETIEFKNIPSPHMTFGLMWELKEIIDANINRDDLAGVLISHGTDTLEETAYFLELTTNYEKPIVIVGSMKNTSDLGYEGAANIAAGIYTIISPESKRKGVLQVGNETINSAYYVTKTHTTNVATFKSPSFGELGYISMRKPIFHRNIIERQYIESSGYEEKVGLIKMAAGISGDIFDYYIEKGYKGLVVEALGAGNIPPSALEGLDRALEANIPIVLVSRCSEGSVEPIYAYEGGGEELREKGLIFAGIQNGQKARIKLSLLLKKTNDIEEIRSAFEDYLV